MGPANRFKLEKLRIYAYGDANRKQLLDQFVVMFNPQSYTLQHENVYQKLQGINTYGRSALYSFTRRSGSRWS